MNKDKRIRELEDHIYEICDIIYMQCPLEMQDAWLKSMQQRELYDGGIDE
tara:strand:+ start:143 stop:292 length:150 start_codon:yes stop_codon:yes gene_type:complete